LKQKHFDSKTKNKKVTEQSHFPIKMERGAGGAPAAHKNNMYGGTKPFW